MDDRPPRPTPPRTPAKPRLWVDTGITHRPRLQVSPANLPALERALGAADILLFWGGRSIGARAVRACQDWLQVPEQACRITHVALADGVGGVIHATYSLRGGGHSSVRRDPLSVACAGQTVSAVRALPLSAWDARAAVVDAAVAMLTQPYSLRLVALSALAAAAPPAWRARLEQLSPEATVHGQVCSTLVFEAFGALRRDNPLDPRAAVWSAPIVLPAFFFWQPALTDITMPLPTPRAGRNS